MLCATLHFRVTNNDLYFHLTVCLSISAVNGVVHDIDVVRKGIRLLTLMVSSDGFYKMSRLYVTPDSFFLKVRLLVLDTYKCSKPCPDIKLGNCQLKEPMNASQIAPYPLNQGTPTLFLESYPPVGFQSNPSSN